MRKIKLIFVGIVIFILFNIYFYNNFFQERKNIELLYFPTSKTIKPFLMDFSTNMVDYLWFQGLQYYGQHRLTDREYKYLYKIFDILTDLDPMNLRAYSFASFILTYDAKSKDKAMLLLKKGWQMYDSWYFPYLMGFLEYVYDRNYDLAYRYFSLSANYKDAPSYVLFFKNFTVQKGGYIDKSIQLWLHTYKTADVYEKKIAARMLWYLSMYKMRKNGNKKIIHIIDDYYTRLGKRYAYLYKSDSLVDSTSWKEMRIRAKQWGVKW